MLEYLTKTHETCIILKKKEENKNLFNVYCNLLLFNYLLFIINL